MQWEPDPRNEKLKGHVYTSKEASSGGALARPEAAVAVTKHRPQSCDPPLAHSFGALSQSLLCLRCPLTRLGPSPGRRAACNFHRGRASATPAIQRRQHRSQVAVIFGATDRYDIDITQLWIEAPVGASWSVALDVQNDYQTGASPWFVGAQQGRRARRHHERCQHSGQSRGSGRNDPLLLGRW